MVSSIGGSTLAQSLPARAASRASQEVQAAGAQGTATASAATGGEADGPAAAVTRSALSSATDRLGSQLEAQADASRLRQAGGAQDAAEAAGTGEATASASADTESAGSVESAESAESAGSAGTTAQAAGGAGMAGGAGGAGAASSGSSESSDYIAEADTNSDRKVSDEERAAYEKKLAAQAEKSTQDPQAVPPAERSRAQEVQQAYNPQDSEPGLDIMA